MTGLLLVAAGLILLILIRLAVVVLASVVLLAIGASFLFGAYRAMRRRCPHCGKATC